MSDLIAMDASAPERDVRDSVLLDGHKTTPDIDPRIRERFKNVNFLRKWITIEPIMFLYFLAYIPLFTLGEQFVIAQVAGRRNVQVNNTGPSCDSNVSKNASDLEQEIQAEASHWMILLNSFLFLPGVFVTVLIGSYSDQMGRKLGLLSPIIGNFFRCCISVIVIAFDLPFELLTIALVIDGLSGGIALMIAAGFATLSDITTRKQRAFRIMVLEISLGIGLAFGQFGAGLLIKSIGFEYTVGVCGLIQVVNGVYVIFMFIETRIVDRMAKFFTCIHYRRMWHLLTRNDECNRWELFIPLTLLATSSTVESGSLDNLTYFQMARPLCFSSTLIGFWQALNYGVRFTACLITVKLLNERWGDTGLMCFGFISGAIFYALIAFSDSVSMIFHVLMAGAWFSLIVPMVRSIVSKAVSNEEQGVVYSLVGTIQSMCMLLGSTVFNAIYAATLPLFSGTVFLVQAGTLACGLLLTLYFIIKRRREKKSLRLAVITENT